MEQTERKCQDDSGKKVGVVPSVVHPHPSVVHPHSAVTHPHPAGAPPTSCRGPIHILQGPIHILQGRIHILQWPHPFVKSGPEISLCSFHADYTKGKNASAT